MMKIEKMKGDLIFPAQLITQILLILWQNMEEV